MRLHYALILAVDDGRLIANGYGVYRTTEVFGACCYPSLLETGQLRALAKSNCVACAHTVGTHPHLMPAVGRISSVRFIKSSCTAGAADGGLRAENIKFSVTHAEPIGSTAASIFHDKPGCGDSVVDDTVFNGFFCHYRFELFSMDGDVPFSAIHHFTFVIAEYGQPPAFEILHSLVQLSGVRQGKVFPQRPAAYLSA